MASELARIGAADVEESPSIFKRSAALTRKRLIDLHQHIGSERLQTAFSDQAAQALCDPAITLPHRAFLYQRICFMKQRAGMPVDEQELRAVTAYLEQYLLKTAEIAQS